MGLAWRRHSAGREQRRKAWQLSVSTISTRSAVRPTSTTETTITKKERWERARHVPAFRAFHQSIESFCPLRCWGEERARSVGGHRMACMGRAMLRVIMVIVNHGEYLGGFGAVRRLGRNRADGMSWAHGRQGWRVGFRASILLPPGESSAAPRLLGLWQDRVFFGAAMVTAAAMV